MEKLKIIQKNNNKQNKLKTKIIIIWRDIYEYDMGFRYII